MTRAGGYTILEMIATVSIFGATTLVAAPLVSYLLRASAVAPSPVETLSFELVPQLRADLRSGAVRARFELLQTGRNVLLLDTRIGDEERVVAYLAGGGEILRIEHRRHGSGWRRYRESRWRGPFTAWFELDERLVGLEVDAGGAPAEEAPRRLLSIYATPRETAR